MPRRSRSHELEDLSRARLHALFETSGWVVEDIDKDYGEDLLVRIFRDGVATPLKFFVQAKATDNLSRYANKRHTAFYVTLRSEHLDQWSKFLEPVILTLWDARSGETYWVCVQDFLKIPNAARTREPSRLIRIRISAQDMLNESGVEQIRILTKERHRRFVAENIGVEVLMEYLERRYGVTVDYTPEKGLLMFREPNGGVECVFLGKLASMLKAIAAKRGISCKRALTLALESSLSAVEEFESTGMYTVRNQHTGKKERRKLSRAEFTEYIQTEMKNLDEEDWV